MTWSIKAKQEVNGKEKSQLQIGGLVRESLLKDVTLELKVEKEATILRAEGSALQVQGRVSAKAHGRKGTWLSRIFQTVRLEHSA